MQIIPAIEETIDDLLLDCAVNHYGCEHKATHWVLHTTWVTGVPANLWLPACTPAAHDMIAEPGDQNAKVVSFDAMRHAGFTGRNVPDETLTGWAWDLADADYPAAALRSQIEIMLLNDADAVFLASELLEIVLGRDASERLDATLILHDAAMDSL